MTDPQTAPTASDTETSQPKIVFVDTETTSLRHDRRPWEIGLIVRELDAMDEADGGKGTVRG